MSADDASSSESASARSEDDELADAFDNVKVAGPDYESSLEEVVHPYVKEYAERPPAQMPQPKRRRIGVNDDSSSSDDANGPIVTLPWSMPVEYNSAFDRLTSVNSVNFAYKNSDTGRRHARLK